MEILMYEFEDGHIMMAPNQTLSYLNVIYIWREEKAVFVHKQTYPD